MAGGSYSVAGWNWVFEKAGPGAGAGLSATLCDPVRFAIHRIRYSSISTNPIIGGHLCFYPLFYCTYSLAEKTQARSRLTHLRPPW